MVQGSKSVRVMSRGMLLLVGTLLCSTLVANGRAQVSRRYEVADLKALESTFVELAEKVRPSVVAIRTYASLNADGDRFHHVKRPVSQGSGFILSTDGYIATNSHVLEEATDYTVILHNGDRYDAAVVQTDTRSDLAVIKIEVADLKPVRWGDATKVKVNQWTFAVGNPFGLANRDGQTSVTFGTVSALGRDLTRRLAGNSDIHYYGNLIESSSAINPGSSGGPLFNVDGEVIGVVAAIETSSGVSEGAGFAIPVDHYTRGVLDTLMAGRPVRYGYLGVSVSDVAPPRSRRVAATAAVRGARIEAVSPADGPAARAGLKPGDVVIALDGERIEDSDQLVRAIGYTPVDSEVEVTYLRRKVKRKTRVRLADRNAMLGLAQHD